MSERDQTHEVVKWYTRARRFPQLIGKTPDGARIWGGPYTYTQVIGAVVVLVAGTKTVGIWGQFGLIGNALTLLGVAYGTTLALGRMPIGSRNPVAVGSGLIRALSASSSGNVGGRPVRIRRPHRASTRVVINPGAPARPAALPAPVASTASAPPRTKRLPRPRWSRPAPSQNPTSRPAPRGSRSTPSSAPALTGVQRLLAASSAPQED
ncbi:MAG: hypothetical protein L0H79_20830 [Intrasporangium sp.]|uniref:hypothetical protein n=1 Tax=Intrasporangium sp. TaxID=1925024 RepID=UPI00264A094C|nr:hypothetical protein [Intrasporangium sp.]MDN5798172.1 hypothetical protein [Intrasporangium sp.]